MSWRRALLPTGPSAPMLCCFAGAPPPTCVQQRRGVAGGMGRGDLFHKNYENAANRTRGLGIQRGLVHNSQATEPQSGQLYYRKRILHGSMHGVGAASGASRAPIANWSYLVPSLRQGIEAAIPPHVYTVLLAGNGALSAEQESAVREGQRLFRYELHQRIPLLEDSFADAELPFLVEWLLLFKRAWVRPPAPLSPPTVPQRQATASESGERSSITPATATAAAAPFAAISFRDVALSPSRTREGRGPAALDTNPVAHQILDLDERVMVLVDHVRRSVEAELAAAGQAATAAGPSSVRERRKRAQWETLAAKWAEALAWQASGDSVPP